MMIVKLVGKEAEVVGDLEVGEEEATAEIEIQIEEGMMTNILEGAGLEEAEEMRVIVLAVEDQRDGDNSYNPKYLNNP